MPSPGKAAKIAATAFHRSAPAHSSCLVENLCYDVIPDVSYPSNDVKGEGAVGCQNISCFHDAAVVQNSDLNSEGKISAHDTSREVTVKDRDVTLNERKKQMSRTTDTSREVTVKDRDVTLKERKNQMSRTTDTTAEATADQNNSNHGGTKPRVLHPRQSTVYQSSTAQDKTNPNFEATKFEHSEPQVIVMDNDKTAAQKGIRHSKISETSAARDDNARSRISSDARNSVKDDLILLSEYDSALCRHSSIQTAVKQLRKSIEALKEGIRKEEFQTLPPPGPFQAPPPVTGGDCRVLSAEPGQEARQSMRSVSSSSSETFPDTSSSSARVEVVRCSSAVSARENWTTEICGSSPSKDTATEIADHAVCVPLGVTEELNQVNPFHNAFLPENTCSLFPQPCRLPPPSAQAVAAARGAEGGFPLNLGDFTLNVTPGASTPISFTNLSSVRYEDGSAPSGLDECLAQDLKDCTLQLLPLEASVPSASQTLSFTEKAEDYVPLDTDLFTLVLPPLNERVPESFHTQSNVPFDTDLSILVPPPLEENNSESSHTHSYVPLDTDATEHYVPSETDHSASNYRPAEEMAPRTTEGYSSRSRTSPVSGSRACAVTSSNYPPLHTATGQPERAHKTVKMKRTGGAISKIRQKGQNSLNKPSSGRHNPTDKDELPPLTARFLPVEGEHAASPGHREFVEYLMQTYLSELDQAEYYSDISSRL